MAVPVLPPLLTACFHFGISKELLNDIYILKFTGTMVANIRNIILPAMAHAAASVLRIINVGRGRGTRHRTNAPFLSTTAMKCMSQVPLHTYLGSFSAKIQQSSEEWYQFVLF